MAGNSFSVAIWGLNGFALLLALLLTVNVQKRWAHVLFVFLAGIMSINAVMHFGQSIFCTTRHPVVVTAVALVLPLSVRSIRHEVSSGWVAKRELWWLLAGGLLAMPLIIWLLMVGSQYLVQI